MSSIPTLRGKVLLAIYYCQTSSPYKTPNIGNIFVEFYKLSGKTGPSQFGNEIAKMLFELDRLRRSKLIRKRGYELTNTGLEKSMILEATVDVLA